MSIRQTIKNIVKTVRVMEDGEPVRVSFVTHGANQTPFHELKMAHRQGESAIEESEMKKEATQKSGASLVRVKFSKDKYAQAEDAIKWMTEKGYETPEEIMETDNEFYVDSPEFKEDTVTKAVEADEGVTYELLEKSDDSEDEDDEFSGDAFDEDGDLEEGDEELEDDFEKKQSDRKAAEKELAEKINQFRMYYSDNKRICDVLKEADDGVPVGAGDLYTMFTVALTNAAAEKDMDAVAKVSEEFGKMFTELMVITEKFMADAKGDDMEEKEATEKEAEVEADAEVTEADNSEGEVKDKEEASKEDDSDAETESDDSEEGEEGSEADAEEKAADTDGEDETSPEDRVAKAVMQALEAAKVTEVLGELMQHAEKLDSRISELEKVEQTRKGADYDKPAETAARKSAPSRLQLNQFGLKPR